MRFADFILLTCATLTAPAFALDKFQILQTVKDLADHILAAGQGNVPSANSTIFAEDVTGSVDVYGDINGRQASTDFIFSTFAFAHTQPSVPSPIGQPLSYNVTAVSVEHDIASASITFQLQYASISRTFPLQFDGWYRINQDGLIASYDIVFRHFTWLMDEVMPLLEPEMIALLGSSAANMTADEALTAYLINSICLTAATSCTGGNAQFSSVQSCMSGLGSKAVGTFDRLKDDSLLCRAMQIPLLANAPSTYCPSLAASGGSTCVAQNYTATVLDTNTNAPGGWLGPKFVTPENAPFVSHIKAVSGQELDPLIAVALNAEELHSWDPTLYASATFGRLFLFYYAFAHVTFWLYRRCSTVFPDLPYEHQKNVVMYTMNIIFTAIALALQLAPIRWAFGYYALWEIKTIRMSAIMVSSLYIFELLFRFNMRYPLVIHHYFTILAISLSVTLVEYTQSPTYVVSGIIWLLQATTEQPTFVGLLGYRMKWNRLLVAKILKFAAIQTFVIKTAAAAGVFAYWAINQRYSYRAIDVAWSAVTIIIVFGLMSTQVWGSWITYAIGINIEKKELKKPGHGCGPVALSEPEGKGFSPNQSQSQFGSTMGLVQIANSPIALPTLTSDPSDLELGGQVHQQPASCRPSYHRLRTGASAMTDQSDSDGKDEQMSPPDRPSEILEDVATPPDQYALPGHDWGYGYGYGNEMWNRPVGGA